MIPPTRGEDRPLAVADTPLIAWLNTAVCLTALAVAAACGVSSLLTVTPWGQFIGANYFVPFFFAIFPLFGWAVFVLQSKLPGAQRGRRSSSDLRKDIPRGAVVPVLASFAAVWVTSLASMSSLPGQPEYLPTGHRYVFDDHGTLTPTTREAWLHAVAAGNRLFLDVAFTFTLLAAAITWAERNRRRGLVPSPRWRHPVRPRPRRVLPAPLLTLAATAGLAGFIACAILIICRVDGYNGGGIYLRAGQQVSVVLPSDDYVVFVGCTDSMACPQLAPDQFSAITSSGPILGVVSDPSSDHLSEAGQPFIGELSFSVPQREAVRFELGTRLGQPAFVVPSPGREALALAGWIALGVLSLVVLVAALIGLTQLVIWRLGFGVAPGHGWRPDVSPPGL